MAIPRSQHGWNVILIDDDASLRRALARAISLGGYPVAAFDSVEALVEHGIPARDTCLVLDVHLPGINGIAFKKALAREGRDIPTVFITALAADEVREPLATLAPVAVLHKPFNRNDLLDAIGRACR
ncbi:MAG: response regulator transcription factor [Burkholderiales bacterium]